MLEQMLKCSFKSWEMKSPLVNYFWKHPRNILMKDRLLHSRYVSETLSNQTCPLLTSIFYCLDIQEDVVDVGEIQYHQVQLHCQHLLAGHLIVMDFTQKSQPQLSSLKPVEVGLRFRPD
jgi:hypothetical protein